MFHQKNKDYVFTIILAVSLFLQITYLPQIFSTVYSPNLVLILLIAFAAATNSEDVLYYAFVVGVIFDILSISPFGLVTISMIVTIFITLRLCSVTIKSNLSYKLFLVSLTAIIIYNILYIFLANINNISAIISDVYDLISIIFIQTVFVSVLIYPLTNFLVCKNEK